jgi:hypothetical protein
MSGVSTHLDCGGREERKKERMGTNVARGFLMFLYSSLVKLIAYFTNIGVSKRPGNKGVACESKINGSKTSQEGACDHLKVCLSLHKFY